MTTKGPWKGSSINNILYINDPMPRIESQNANKSQNDPYLCVKEMKEHIQNHNHKHFAKITEIQ